MPFPFSHLSYKAINAPLLVCTTAALYHKYHGLLGVIRIARLRLMRIDHSSADILRWKYGKLYLFGLWATDSCALL